jgi:hypothetical protein
VISGFFVPEIRPQPLIVVSMRIPALLSAWVPVPFIIDTGASRTFIHALDAMGKFGLTPAALDSRNWADGIPIGGVGGEIQARPLEAQYAFAHDDGVTFEVIDAPVFLGDISTQGLPSQDAICWHTSKYV